MEINPIDAKNLKVQSGDRISIGSSRGRVKDIIVRVTEVVKDGSVFVPFHFSEQLINILTISEFDPKSFEPNYKQCAVNLFSVKVPEGLKMKEEEISGELAYETSEQNDQIGIKNKQEVNR